MLKFHYISSHDYVSAVFTLFSHSLGPKTLDMFNMKWGWFYSYWLLMPIYYYENLNILLRTGEMDKIIVVVQRHQELTDLHHFSSIQYSQIVFT